MQPNTFFASTDLTSQSYELDFSEYLSHLQSVNPAGLCHKIWLGSSYALHPNVMKNLEDTWVLLSNRSDVMPILWVDCDRTSIGPDSIQQAFSVVNVRNLPQAFFKVEVDIGQGLFDFKPYVLPDHEPLMPNFGLRSDCLRLLLLYAFGGLQAIVSIK